MKNKFLFTVCLLLLAALVDARAQDTAFTYQGRLNDGASPATGNYDLRFAVFGASSGGTQIGQTLTNSNVLIEDGLFTVTLDFGDSVFSGSARFLDIGVRTNGATTFTTLAPRQALLPTPYAIHAANAATAATASSAAVASSVVSGSVGTAAIQTNVVTVEKLNLPSVDGRYVNLSGDTMAGKLNLPVGGLAVGSTQMVVTSSGVLGIGTSSPSSARAMTIQGVGTNSGWIQFRTFEGTNKWHLSYKDNGLHFTETSVADNRLFLADGGKVGIGTATPATALHVNGTITANSFTGSGAGLTSVSGASIAPATIDTAQLAESAVTTVNIADGTIAANDVNASSFNTTFWKTDGNAGTTPGTHSLGTTDNQPLEMKVNGARALRLEPNATGPNLIGGSEFNYIEPGVVASTIAGGGTVTASNRITAHYSTIGGGVGNAVSGTRSTVSGGGANIIQTNAEYSVVGGGRLNAIQANTTNATIAGGFSGVISSGANNSTIGGGEGNIVRTNAEYATIPGGRLNTATNYAFAAGRRAKANHTGAFVWADSQNADFASTANNQLLIRAAGGVGIGTNNPASALHVNGTVSANDFVGSGAGLTGLNAANLSSGLISDARLSTNVALLNNGNHFSGTNSFSGSVSVGTNSPQAGLHVTATETILTPKVLFQVQNGNLGYANLGGPRCIAVSGNLMAIGAEGGLTLVDVSNPLSPVRRSQILDEGAFTHITAPSALAFSGNVLAVASEDDSAVTLISVANPANPVKLAELRDGFGGWNDLAGASSLAISGNIMAIGSLYDDAVTLVDITTPGTPTLHCVIKNGQFGFTELEAVRCVALSGNLMAVGALNWGGEDDLNPAITLVDISNPASPVPRAVLKKGQNGYNYLATLQDLILSNNRLVIAGDASEFSTSGVTLVDVTVPTSPVKLVELSSDKPGFSTLRGATGLAISGTRLAVGTFYTTVTILDIADPAKAKALVAAKNTIGGAKFLDGPWKVAFWGSNFAAVSENSDSLTLFSFSPAELGLVSQGWVGIGTELAQAPLHVVGNVIIENADLFRVAASSIALGTQSIAEQGSFVAGSYNSATASSTAIGRENVSKGGYSTAVGIQNRAEGYFSVAIGNNSVASGNYTVAIGNNNEASGSHSYAVGSLAKASHRGAFVWSDSSSWDTHPANAFYSTAPNQFLIRASGGVGINKNDPSTALDVGGTVSAASFKGGGGMLTFLNASELTSGTVPNARLSGTYSSALTLNNSGNSFAGNGSGLTSLNAGNISSGTIANARLSANVPLKNTANTFTSGTQTIQAGAASTKPLVVQGAASQAANLQEWQNSSGSLLASVSASGVLNGNGSGLTALDANNLSSGTVPSSALNNAWKIGGNTGTTPGTHFLGTMDNQPLELRVNGQRALRLEPKADGRPNVIGGSGSAVENDVAGATVGGGYNNRVRGGHGTIGGGQGNAIGFYSNDSTIGGGAGNLVGDGVADSTIGGGFGNVIGALGVAGQSTIGGGARNVIEAGGFSTIGGGNLNTNRGSYATIPGGLSNTATNFAFAAGRQAKANHTGSFVWGDSSTSDIASTNANSITMRAVGGTRILSSTGGNGVYLAPGSGTWTSMSDRNLKENFENVDSREVLERVAALPIARWNYTTQDASIRHIGPTAQDFRAAFSVGDSETGISTVDADGIALAAIQGLNQKLEQKLRAKETEIQSLLERLEKIERLLQQQIGGEK